MNYDFFSRNPNFDPHMLRTEQLMFGKQLHRPKISKMQNPN
jgi:hypothetical protein